MNLPVGELNKNIIKCAFCDWTTLRWTTSKGQHRAGFVKLQSHVMINHEEDYLDLLRRLDNGQ